MLVNNKYKIIEKIGFGMFGTIYKGENIRTKEQVAIKVETISSDNKMLKHETTVYQYLQNCKGIPHVKWYGKDKVYYYMVIELLGESLQTLKTRAQSFSLHLTLKIGIQVILLIKTIHDKGLIHRDIKPENFLFGIDNKSQLYIIDFGFCKSYLNDGEHKPQKKTTGLIGSPSYSSVTAHLYLEQSRRDDLESVGYMLLYLHLGRLPWQNIDDDEERNQKICSMKQHFIENRKETEKETEITNIPSLFIEYFKAIKTIKYEEEPDYLSLIELMKREISSNQS